MGVELLPLVVYFGSLVVDFGTFFEFMLGNWKLISDLLESILALCSDIRLLSYNRGLLETIMGHLESILASVGQLWASNSQSWASISQF